MTDDRRCRTAAGALKNTYRKRRKAILAARGYKTVTGIPARAYRCDCGWYHITTQTRPDWIAS